MRVITEAEGDTNDLAIRDKGLRKRHCVGQYFAVEKNTATDNTIKQAISGIHFYTILFLI